MSAKLFVLYFILLGLTLHYGACQTHTPLVRNQPHPDEISTIHEIHYYKFSPKVAEDLSIEAAPRDEASIPVIYVSMEYEQPNVTHADFVAGASGYNILTIPSQYVPTDKPVYIAVKCFSVRCLYNVQVIATSEYVLQVNTVVKRTFNQRTAELIKVEIPKSDDITHMIIYAQVLNINSIFEPIHMYVNKGHEPPTSSTHDLESVPSWMDGTAVVIYPNSRLFCTGCTYTVLIEAPAETQLKIEARTYTKANHLPFHGRVYDGVTAKQEITYFLNFTAYNITSQTITVIFQPYEGHAQLYLHPDHQPAQLHEYMWEIRDSGTLRFVLTETERKHRKVKEGIYITVLGVTTSTFELHATISDVQGAHVKFGAEEVGYIEHLELVQYSLWGEKHETFPVTLTLKVLSGQASIYAKSCGKSICNFTREEIHKIDAHLMVPGTANPTFMIGSNLTRGTNTLSFVHHGSLCHGDDPEPTEDACTYAIAVMGHAHPYSHYTLVAAKEKNQIYLKEGQPVHGSLQYLEYIPFSFTITNETGIKSVIFHLVPISGTIFTYSSRLTTQPCQTSYEKNAFNGNSLEYHASEGGGMAATYHVRVYGWTAATFTITATVIRNIPDNADHTNHTHPASTPMQLRLGQPMSVNSESADPHHFYFNPYLMHWQSWFHGTVDIRLIPIKGNFVMVMDANGTYPSLTNYTWKADPDDNTISLNASDPGFGIDHQYKITVYPQANSANSFSFMVMYALSGDTFYLRANLPHSDWVDKANPLYFMTDYYEGDGDLIFTKHSGSDRFEIYLSVDTKNPFPTEKNYNISTATRHTSIIRLNATYLTKICGVESGMGGGPCPIHGAVRTSSPDWVEVSLLLTKTNQIIQLSEGRKVAIPMLDKEPINLLFDPATVANGLSAVAVSYHERLAMIANVVQTRLNDRPPKTVFPSYDKYDYAAREVAKGDFDFINTLFIPSSNVTMCMTTKCLLAITLFPEDIMGNLTIAEIDQHEGFIPHFSIVASSTLVPLTIGESINGHVDEGQYIYYSVRIHRPICQIYISLTPLSNGDPDIVVAYGSDKRPTIDGDNYDFASITDRSEQIEISNVNILPDRTSMEGVWVIGVYGYTQAKYKLSVFYENDRVVAIEPGKPMELLLQHRKSVYYKFYNTQNKDFKFRITREFGFGSLYINKVKDTEELLDHLPNSTHHDWSVYTANTRDQIDILTTDPKYCQHCYYLIQVAATEQNLKFVLTLIHPDQPVTLQSGKGLRDFAQKDEMNKYIFENLYGSFLDINLVIYSGYVTLIYSLALNNQGQGEQNNYAIITGDPNKHFMNIRINDTKPQTYYSIKVMGNAPSNYTILVNSEGRSIELTDGVLQYGYLDPGAYDNYRFYCDLSYSSRKRLKIVVNVYNDEFTQINAANIQGLPRELPRVTVKYRDSMSGRNGSVFTEPALLRNDTTINGLTSSVMISELIQYGVQNGTWLFEVKNTQSGLLNYSIVVKTKDIYVIPPNTVHLTRLGVNEYDIFEVYIYEKGVLAIEISQCYGTVIFQATSSIEKLNRGEFELVVNIPYEDLLYGELPVEPGIVYIKVRATSGILDDNFDPTQEALFKIETRFFRSTELRPYTYFFAGDDGRVFWEPKDGKIDLKWRQMGIIHDNAKALFDQYTILYKYKVVLAKDDIIADTVAKCDWAPDRFEGHFEQKASYYNTSEIYLPSTKSATEFIALSNERQNHTIKIDEEGTYYVQVVGNIVGVKDGKTVWSVPIAYKNTEIVNSNLIMGVPAILGVLGLITIVVLGFFAYIYYKKYRLVKRRLTFELQEVRLGNNVLESDFEPPQTEDTKKGLPPSGYKDFVEESNK